MWRGEGNDGCIVAPIEDHLAGLTEGRLKNIPAADLDEACATHMRLGKRVRDLMEEEGADMPEDMPPADSIADAKKRLRDYGKGRRKLR